jgi:PAS domain S-box-containing protein
VHHVWAVPGDSQKDEHGQIVQLSGIVQEITARKLAEERLRLQAAALEAAANGIVITDVDGAIEWVNPAFAALTGYSPAEAIGHNPRELVRSGVQETDFYRAMWATIRAGQVWHGELVNRRKDGTLYAEEQTITPVRDEEGNVRHFIGIKQDITGRRAAEAALRRSEANLARAQDITQLGSWNWDLVAGASEWSAQMYAIFGRDPALGAPSPDEFRSMLHPDDQATVDSICQAVVAGAAVSEVEVRSHPDHGPVRVFAGQVEGDRDATGRTVKLIGTLLDITARKQVEAEREQLLQQVRAQADQMAQVMDSVPEGVMLLDAGCRVLTANLHAVAQLQFLAGAGVGATLTELAGAPLAQLLSAPPAGQWHIVEAGAQTFEVIARPVEIGPRPGGWVLVVRDITQLRAVERQMQRQERMVAIGQLAAGIAHDFNNLMSVITLYAQMLAKSPGLDTRAQARLATIEQQALRATEMIRQILDFSRRTVVDRHLLDLLALLRQQVELLQRTLPEHIELELSSAPGDYFVKGDPTRLQQVLMNLAFNARDAMPDGGQLLITLDHVAVHSAHDAPLPGMIAGAWVRLTVRDSGLGMPAEVLNHIFEPFFTTKEPGKGTGLGLAQVYGIVGQHDGHITVSSRPGHGAAFTIYLPAQRTPAGDAGDTAAAGALPLGHGEAILVVEDDAPLRATVVELLESWGYRVQQASDGADALAMLVDRHESVDLVLSDAIMPRLGGVALFKELRARNLEQPVILMSGHPLIRDVDELRGLGLFAWITKPPEAERLAQTIAAALQT